MFKYNWEIIICLTPAGTWGARPNHVRVKTSSFCFPWDLVSFVRAEEFWPTIDIFTWHVFFQSDNVFKLTGITMQYDLTRTLTSSQIHQRCKQAYFSTLYHKRLLRKFVWCACSQWKSKLFVMNHLTTKDSKKLGKATTMGGDFVNTFFFQPATIFW